MKSFFILAIFLMTDAFGASSILPTDRQVDWVLGTTAGVRGGIPNRQTVFTNFAAGATAAQIDNAITLCPSNQVVKLGVGTFTLTASITLNKSGVTLRGSGNDTGGTLLKGSVLLVSMGNLSYPDGGNISITSGYTKGASNITLSSSSTVSVGEIVKIDQVIDPAFMASSDGAIRGVQQTVEIMAKSGNQITIWPPLYYGLTPANTPLVKKFTGTFIRYTGLEDVKMDVNGTTEFFTQSFNCSDCWVKNVQQVNGNAYYNYWDFTLFGEFTHNNINTPTSFGPNHGGILVGGTGTYNSAALGVSATAIYDNIFIKCGPGVEVNTGSSGNIVAYNFCYDADYGSEIQLAGIDMNHSAQDMFNLYEGNCVNQITSDGYFGTQSHDTIFRNWSTGWTPTHPTGQSICLALLAGADYNNVLGNVWGVTNNTIANADLTFQPPGNDYNFSGTSYIYVLGVNKSSFHYLSDAYDTQVTNTVILHSNWDSYNKAVDWGTNSSHTLPDSLYLTSKPTWFGNLTWPPYDPAVGYTNLTYNSIPAGYRYFNGVDPAASTTVFSVGLTGNVTINGGVIIK